MPTPVCVCVCVCFDVRSLGEKSYSVVRGVRVEDKIETSSGMRSKSNKEIKPKEVCKTFHEISKRTWTKII